jgi:NADH:ubiquinone oxidoreductase subunit 2 (subunit N)
VPKIAYFYFVWHILRLFFIFDMETINDVCNFFVLLLVFSIAFCFMKTLNEFDFYKLFAYSGIGIIV